MRKPRPKRRLVAPTAAVIAAGLLVASWPQLGVEARQCDYSFIVSQPVFRLVGPPEGATDAPFLSDHLVIATGESNLADVEALRLLSASGHLIRLARSGLFAASPDPENTPASIGGARATMWSISIPKLAPSTTYQLVLDVRTIDPPSGCPKRLTERIGSFTTASTALASLSEALKGPAAPPSGAAASLSGPQIFHLTTEALRWLRYPPFVTFLVHVRSTIGGKPFAESFQSIVRTSDDTVATHSIPIATTNKPENPYGFNIPILEAIFPSHPRENHDEPFGVPKISPLYDFELRPHGEPSMPEPAAVSTPTNIRTLGRIKSVARDYDVSLVGIESYGSRYVYHLKLQPIESPQSYRLREMWVDTKAFVIWKLTSAGIFQRGAAATVSWNVKYSVVDGYWLMDEESTTAVFRSGAFLTGKSAVVYDGLTYSFSDFEFPKHLSDFAFFDTGGGGDAVEF